MSHKESGHGSSIDITQANALAEGLSVLAGFLPSITHIFLQVATNDTKDRMNNWRNNWKGAAH